jgi:hypothetical protein
VARRTPLDKPPNSQDSCDEFTTTAEPLRATLSECRLQTTMRFRLRKRAM